MTAPRANAGVPRQKVAMFVGAHPDDIDYYAGGLVWNLASKGWRIRCIVLTRGEKGATKGVASAALARTRVAEQRESLRILGCNSVLTGEFRDGELDLGAAREFLTLQVRKTMPEVLVSFDPWRQYETHPDHRVCGFATVEARRTASHPGYYPGQRVGPFDVPRLMLFKPQLANHHEGMTRAAMKKKVEAVLAHKTQFDAEVREAIMTSAKEDGRTCGLRYSEPYHIIE